MAERLRGTSCSIWCKSAFLRVFGFFNYSNDRASVSLNCYDYDSICHICLRLHYLSFIRWEVNPMQNRVVDILLWEASQRFQLESCFPLFMGNQTVLSWGTGCLILPKIYVTDGFIILLLLWVVLEQGFLVPRFGCIVSILKLMCVKFVDSILGEGADIGMGMMLCGIA